MAAASGAPRFLVISNGHGEDAIAAVLVRHLKQIGTVDAYPVIGAGSAYDGICPIVGPRATVASEGWRNVKGSLTRDVATGGLGTILPAFRFLRSIRGRYDRLIVVGDMVGVLACLATGNRDLFYLDVYKTGAARLYSSLERWAIRRTCSTVFCRADSLAALLREDGVDARAAGNLMMDAIPRAEYDARSRRLRPLSVTLLPGSRALTAESFTLQVAALRTLPPDLVPDIFLAVAGSVDIDQLAGAAGLRRHAPQSTEATDLGQLTDGTLTIHMARGAAMGNLVDASDLVMSQAGTATVQSLGLGRPAITFINPRDRRSRFEDEQQLFGEARVVVEADPVHVGGALRRLLNDADERARLGTIGRERIGGPGALASILAVLQSDRAAPAPPMSSRP